MPRSRNFYASKLKHEQRGDSCASTWRGRSVRYDSGGRIGGAPPQRGAAQAHRHCSPSRTVQPHAGKRPRSPLSSRSASSTSRSRDRWCPLVRRSTSPRKQADRKKGRGLGRQHLEDVGLPRRRVAGGESAARLLLVILLCLVSLPRTKIVRGGGIIPS